MNIKPTKGLLVRDWKQNVINIVQFPRAASIPSCSPFSLKLETFVRQNGLEYKNVSNDFDKGSAKGQVPFIELNGRSYSDSNNIIEILKKEFNLTADEGLSPKEQADARAYTVLLEESFFRTIAYLRSVDPKWLFSVENGFLGNLSGVKKVLAKTAGPLLLKRGLTNALRVQGIGRNSLPEIEEIIRRDLTALSTLLGEKPYFFGDKPTTFDAVAFGHLAQLFYTPQPTEEPVKFADEKTPNIRAFVDRVKADVWPDWDEIIKTLALNPKEPEPEPVPAPPPAAEGVPAPVPLSPAAEVPPEAAATETAETTAA